MRLDGSMLTWFFSTECQGSQWQALVEELVTTALDVASVVSPVVSHSSPEGHIPTDAILGMC